MGLESEQNTSALVILPAPSKEHLGKKDSKNNFAVKTVQSLFCSIRKQPVLLRA